MRHIITGKGILTNVLDGSVGGKTKRLMKRLKSMDLVKRGGKAQMETLASGTYHMAQHMICINTSLIRTCVTIKSTLFV